MSILKYVAKIKEIVHKDDQVHPILNGLDYKYGSISHNVK